MIVLLTETDSGRAIPVAAESTDSQEMGVGMSYHLIQRLQTFIWTFHASCLEMGYASTLYSSRRGQVPLVTTMQSPTNSTSIHGFKLLHVEENE